MPARFRTFLGIALFVPLAAILLATFACLPAPVGDPETSKIDDALTGIYRGGDAQSTILVLIRPWDSHTYLLEYVAVEKKDDKETHGILHFKAWLTKFGDQTFLTAQPMDDLSYAVGDTGEKPYWAVFRLDKTPTGLVASMVKPDSDFVKDLTTRQQLEDAIKAHALDKGLYSEPLTFKKLDKEDKAFIEEILGKINSGGLK
jgi:hypothetical protein